MVVWLVRIEAVRGLGPALGHLAVLGPPVLEPNPYLLLGEADVQCELHAPLVVHVRLAAVRLFERGALPVGESRLFPHAQQAHWWSHCRKATHSERVFLFFSFSLQDMQVPVDTKTFRVSTHY